MTHTVWGNIFTLSPNWNSEIQITIIASDVNWRTDPLPMAIVICLSVNWRHKFSKCIECDSVTRIRFSAVCLKKLNFFKDLILAIDWTSVWKLIIPCRVKSLKWVATIYYTNWWIVCFCQIFDIEKPDLSIYFLRFS